MEQKGKISQHQSTKIYPILNGSIFDLFEYMMLQISSKVTIKNVQKLVGTNVKAIYINKE